MELNQLEMRVLDALIQDDPEEDVIRSQLKDATVRKRDYTGAGLYTEISVAEDCPRLSASHRYIEETPKAHLEHPELPDGAGVLLWFKDGYMHTLECYSYEGDWPADESKFTVSV